MATFNSDGNQITGPLSVKSLHDAAACHDGDTITLPTGSFAWTQTLAITKAITLQGSSTVDWTVGPSSLVANTIITRGTSQQLVDFRANTGTVQRATGIAWMEGAGGAANDLLEIKGTTPVRIDHCYFQQMNLQANVIWCLNYNYGVFDHNVFDVNHGMILCYPGELQPDLGDFAWERAAGFGGPNFFFLENNWSRHGCDIAYGGKLVVRFNHFQGDLGGDGASSATTVCHGTGRQGQGVNNGRGGRAYEVYGNTFIFGQTDGVKSLDGQDSGSGYYYNNTFTKNGHSGPIGGIETACTRAGFNFGTPFFGTHGLTGSNWDYFATRADGTHVDGEASWVFASGTTGAGTNANGPIVDSGNPGWGTNIWRGYIVRRNSDGMPGCIKGNTNNSLDIYTIGFPENWVAGQGYQIVKCLQMMDGPGAGVSNPINRASPGWPNQVLEGLYSFNNQNLDTGQQMDIIIPVENSIMTGGTNGPRVFNRTQMPGYTPYVFPHPLVGGSTKIIGLTGPGGASTLAYGNVQIGSISPTKLLTVSNTGNTLLTVTGVSYPTGFTGNTGGFTVTAGSSFDIVVTFTPLLAQLYSGNITVASDATSGTNTILATGTGTTPTQLPQGHRKQARDAFQF